MLEVSVQNQFADEGRLDGNGERFLRDDGSFRPKKKSRSQLPFLKPSKPEPMALHNKIGIAAGCVAAVALAVKFLSGLSA
jgi:hypothetical protein